MHSDVSMECEICHKICKNVINYRYHKKTNHSSPEEIDQLHTCCELCGKRIYVTSLPSHMAAMHGKEKPSFKCDKCEKAFPSEEKLQRHIEAHFSTTVFKCTECGKGFPTEYYLNEHIESQHKVEKPFDCDKCPMKFKTKSCLKKHSAVHSEVKAFVCVQCGKGYSQKHSLNSHMKIHEDEKLGPNACKCPDCGKCFKNRLCLKAHILRTHRTDLVAGKRIFSCSICGRQLYDERNLNKHIAAVHGSDKVQKEKTTKKPEEMDWRLYQGF